MEKTINFFGKNNRYQMKKVIKPDEPKEKKNMEKINTDFFHVEKQQLDICDPFTDSYELMSKSINAKIESYKHQDKLKNRFTEEYVTKEDVIEMLRKSPYCYYCEKELLIIYLLKREPMQWTLDRISNDLAHEKTNVVLSCLKCNLERRCKSKDKFFFTKQMKISKMDT